MARKRGNRRVKKEVIVEKRGNRRKESSKKPERVARKEATRVTEKILQQVLPSDEWASLAADAVGLGANLGLSAIPGGGVAEAANSIFHLWSTKNGKQSKTPFHPGNGFKGMGMSPVVRRKGFAPGMTLLRQAFLPSLVNSRKTGEEPISSIGFAQSEQLPAFQNSASGTLDNKDITVFSGRQYLCPIPVTAVRGEMVVSTPIDVVVGLLAHTRLAQMAELYDRLRFTHVSLVYVPTCSADTGGALILLGSEDPERTVAYFPEGEERISAAFSYDAAMATTQLWNGCALKPPLDDEMKYQGFVPHDSSSSELRFVAPGRVEVLASSEWSLSSSPGYLMLEYEVTAENDVPSVSAASITAISSYLCVNSGDSDTYIATGDNIDKIAYASVAMGAQLLPLGRAATEDVFSWFDSGLPKEIPASPGTNVSKWYPGGLKSLGFKYVSSTATALTMVPPPGVWNFITQTFCSFSSTPAPTVPQLAGVGPGITVQNLGTLTTTSASILNEIDTWKVTVTGYESQLVIEPAASGGTPTITANRPLGWALHCWRSAAPTWRFDELVARLIGHDLHVAEEMQADIGEIGEATDDGYYQAKQNKGIRSKKITKK